MDEKDEKLDIIDEDLYEEIDDDELLEILEQERQRVIEKEKAEKEKPSRRPFPKWAFWMIAGAMFLNVIAIFPQTFSIPAIEFLITSAKLSVDPAIDEYQDSVVVVSAGNSKGTGFSISPEGTIITNNHVVEGEKVISIAFPEEGLFAAEVVATYPSIDLAVLQVDGVELPFLELAEATRFDSKERIHFIGNPLRFNGIANQGNIIGYTDLKNWDQQVLMLDAPIYRGNSGSPVINQHGKVIGVIFATLKHDQHGKVGLAVPIDYYYQALEE